MYYSYVEIEYVATSFSPTRMDLAYKLLYDKWVIGNIILFFYVLQQLLILLVLTMQEN